MKPIGILMNEHRRIEKVIDVLKLELQNQQRTQTPNTGIIITAIDFFKTYADTTHHGKEEDILFKTLQENKDLSEKHNTMLNELLKEHSQARLLVNQLQQEIDAYRKGEKKVIRNMSNSIQKLSILYTNHIDKEDNSFCKPIMQQYFSDEEQDKLLDEFYKFDKDMIHKKYENVIEHLQEL